MFSLWMLGLWAVLGPAAIGKIKKTDGKGAFSVTFILPVEPKKASDYVTLVVGGPAIWLLIWWIKFND